MHVLAFPKKFTDEILKSAFIEEDWLFWIISDGNIY